jgi:hypothetical protein
LAFGPTTVPLVTTGMAKWRPSSNSRTGSNQVCNRNLSFNDRLRRRSNRKRTRWWQNFHGLRACPALSSRSRSSACIQVAGFNVYPGRGRRRVSSTYPGRGLQRVSRSGASAHIQVGSSARIQSIEMHSRLRMLLHSGTTKWLSPARARTIEPK